MEANQQKCSTKNAARIVETMRMYVPFLEQIMYNTLEQDSAWQRRGNTNAAQIFAWRYQGQDPNDDRGDRNICKPICSTGENYTD